jgi:hypothetical protein
MSHRHHVGEGRILQMAVETLAGSLGGPAITLFCEGRSHGSTTECDLIWKPPMSNSGTPNGVWALDEND